MEERNCMDPMDIMELKREELSNIEDIVIDTEKSVERRIRSFLEQTKNPFAQNVGEYILQVGFEEGTNDLIEDKMALLAERKTQTLICAKEEVR
ncbi:MAG: hypothetical protein HFH41_05275 [Lachnospiraceae bacterium]|nr:hypothetical protein [Lachnospiraceae bacterium]